MTKPGRIFFGVGVFLLLLAVIPLSQATRIKESSYSKLRGPVSFSRNAAQWILDAVRFHRNAEELRSLRSQGADPQLDSFQAQEIVMENERLTQLLEMRRILPGDFSRAVFARVIEEELKGTASGGDGSMP